jgi:glutathione S-transferase
MENPQHPTSSEGLEHLPLEDIRQTKSFSKAPTPIKVAKGLCDILQIAGKRASPSTLKKDHIRLITIGPSHYCEKARWGLDLIDNDPDSLLYYTEDAHPPMFHSFASVAASEDGKSMVPMTVPEDASQPVLHDSTKILKQYCPFLYPDCCVKEIDEMEGDLDRRLGPTVRVMIYYSFFQSSDYDNALVELMSRNTSKIESLLMDKMLNQGLKKGLKAVMKINDESAQISEKAIRQVFDEYSDKLSDGRSYLCDTAQNEAGFTAADLTLAALASPLLMPKELIPIQLQPEKLPANLVSLRQELRDTLAGQHVLSIYHKHRFGIGSKPFAAGLAKGCKRSPTSIRMVCLKQGQRNRVPISGSVIKAAAALGGVVAINSFFSKL